MLQWTSSGAVATPRTVQIRVQRSHPDRVRAGAPLPERSLSPAELQANIRFFTEGMSGPRCLPCTRLVLSGVGLAAREDLPDAIHLARDLGVEHVIVHASPEDLGRPALLTHGIDRLVLPVPSEASSRTTLHGALQPVSIPWTGLIRLDTAASPGPGPLLHDVVKMGPAEVVLSSPFPLREDTPAPRLPTIRSWLQACSQVLDSAGMSWRIQGLPGCYLGGQATRIRRAGNRWYVDSEHQLGEALRFFPDVVRFHKSEACRFCPLDSRCDGFFAQWAGRYGLPPLEPPS